MTLTTALLIAAALWGIGLYGALSQQSFVMLMMGLELMINAALLAGAATWRFAGGGGPQGQLLVIVGMAVMAIEMAIGFAVVVNVYRVRQADVTEGIEELKG
ncbi:MAG: NADH-quinone oxidoreductase subunit NuoK [Bradymonadaceae bacterium]